MLTKLKLIVTRLIPRIHNLPQVIYVKWLGYEWFMTKK